MEDKTMKNKNKIVTIVSIVLIIAAIAVAIVGTVIRKNKQNQPDPIQSEEQTETNIPEEEPRPVEEVTTDSEGKPVIPPIEPRETEEVEPGDVDLDMNDYTHNPEPNVVDTVVEYDTKE